MTMGAPGESPAFDLKIAARAAENFKLRKQQREAKEKAINEGRYTQAESPDRLAKRVNRLLGAVHGALAAAAVAAGRRPEPSLVARAKELPDILHTLLQRGPVAPADISDAMLERVIGATRDFLAVGFFEKAISASHAVCRIVTNIGGGRHGLGTGFLVTPSLLITNNHVLRSEDDAKRSNAEFNYQLTDAGIPLPVERFGLKPDVFFLTDKDLDFALVAVEPHSAAGTALKSFGYCPLIAAEGKIIVRDPVNIVQHPKGELKQIAIRNNIVLDLPEDPGLDKFAHYETDTEQGSSGSPVFNDQWEVIALHHSGVPRTNANSQILDRNGNVWPDNGDPDNIDWVANEGIRTSRLVAFIKGAQVREHEKALQAEFIAISSGDVASSARAPKPSTEATAVEPPPTSPTPPPTPAQSPRRAALSAPLSAASGNGMVSLMLPLTIHIGLGTPQQHDTLAHTEVTVGADGAMFEAAIAPDPDYSNRPGFDASFLGFDAPLPTLMPEVRDLALPVGDGIELKYYHYSVIMNAQRKLAFVSAVNFDAGAPFQLARVGKDRWFFDPRVDRDEQLGSELYTDNPLDRGHLTRRADAAWGDTETAAQLANDDSFHWTNCSPQHEIFNQSTKANQRGLLLWGTLENHVSEQAHGGKLSIFNGPIFRPNDRVHRGVPIPREFYKLIVYAKERGEPGAVAFILTQESLIKNLPAEEFEVGPYQPFQVKISDLQSRIKLDFGAFSSFDPLVAIGRETFIEGATADVVAIEALREIVL
jgi:endonuclease G, mitochondrial